MEQWLQPVWLLTLLHLGRRRLRTSAADGSRSANLYLLPLGADANESLPVYRCPEGGKSTDCHGAMRLAMTRKAPCRSRVLFSGRRECRSLQFMNLSQREGQDPPLHFCYSFTRTGVRRVMVSGVTAQSTARTVTPAVAASRKAIAKAGSVASLGCRYFTSAIWITNST